MKKTAAMKEAAAARRSCVQNLKDQVRDHKETIRQVERERDEARAALEELRAAPMSCTLTHAVRTRLPNTRSSIARKLVIGSKLDGVSAHVHVGEYEDGTPGEVFMRLGACHDKGTPDAEVDWKGLAIRLGYLARTFTDAWATAVSIGLQYGVPLEVYLEKHKTQQDVPGFTGDAEFPRVSGLLDYCARWIERRYVKPKGE